MIPPQMYASNRQALPRSTKKKYPLQVTKIKKYIHRHTSRRGREGERREREGRGGERKKGK
jgi:hypothetical protein